MVSGGAYPELIFFVGLFEWVDRIQPFFDPDSKWEYMTQLKQFVDAGLPDDSRFIDAVSSVLTRDCEGHLCSTRTIHFMQERRKNFETLIHDVFNLRGTWQGIPTQAKEPVYDFEYVAEWLGARRSKIEANVLVSRTDALDGVPYFSRAYRFEPFMVALRTASVNGVGDERLFFVGDEKEGVRGLNAGARIWCFLSSSLTQTLKRGSPFSSRARELGLLPRKFYGRVDRKRLL